MNSQIHEVLEVCNNRGGRASRGFSFSSSFSFFFSFSRQLVGHSISTETSVSLPNIESIDGPQREREREGEREGTDIFAGNNGNDFCDRKRNLSRADISFFYEFDLHHHRENFHRIPDDRFSPHNTPGNRYGDSQQPPCRKSVYCRRWNKVLASDLKIASTSIPGIFLINSI